MNIAIICPPYLPVPPVKYGGTERVIYYLIKGLEELGHHVILFAPADSKVDCELIPIMDKSTGFSRNAEEDELFKPAREAASKKAKEELIKNLDRIDIIHSNGIDISEFTDRPHLFTLHLEIVFKDVNPKRQFDYFNSKRNMFYSTISYNALETSKNLNVVGTIYNGMDPKEFPLNETPQDYLAYVGRFNPDKNPHLAMQLAIAKEKELKVAAKYDYPDDEYFQKMCKPYFENQYINNLGEQDNEAKYEVLKNAKVNLHPTNFREPFGLTVLESAYAGTPTLAIRRGSMSELIEDGKSGILVEDFVEGYFKLEDCYNLDRKYISERAGRMFNYKVMAKQYEKAYENILKIYKDKINKDEVKLKDRLSESRVEVKDLYNKLVNN